MADKICREAAEEEVQRIIDFWEVDPEGDGWEASKKRLIFAIQKGRVNLDEEKKCITLKLASPIEKENGEVIEELNFYEPRGNDLEVMDRHKENELMAKTLHLASKMTRLPLGIIKRMASRDVSTMGAIASLFF
ncbi:hypothetical protein LCGC14_1815110 [marine sediment metagenome]|uniref:Phage tail assembly protein n=1 Tax=marine sediment metagenome TaxID=412755 RepID=A0A0F9GKQ0_9ZZZZ|nr:phage tail assembly protein [bacterium]